MQDWHSTCLGRRKPPPLTPLRIPLPLYATALMISIGKSGPGGPTLRA